MAGALLLGQSASPGVGVGWALHVAERRAGGSADTGGSADAGLPSTLRCADDEGDRLRTAMEAAAEELDRLAVATTAAAGADTAAILEAQALLARDPALLRVALERVSVGATAEAAVHEATERQARLLGALDDPLIQARAADVRDVGGRIARWLSGRQEAGLWHADGTPAVLIADDLLPSEVAVLRPGRVAGLALASGSIMGHAAIVARALELPLVLGLGPAILGVAQRARVLVDGTRGRVLVEPDADEVRPVGT